VTKLSIALWIVREETVVVVLVLRSYGCSKNGSDQERGEHQELHREVWYSNVVENQWRIDGRKGSIGKDEVV